MVYAAILLIGKWISGRRSYCLCGCNTKRQKERLNPTVVFVSLSLCYPESYRKKYLGIFNSLQILLRTIKKYEIEIIHTHKRYADMVAGVAGTL